MKNSYFLLKKKRKKERNDVGLVICAQRKRRPNIWKIFSWRLSPRICNKVEFKYARFFIRSSFFLQLYVIRVHKKCVLSKNESSNFRYIKLASRGTKNVRICIIRSNIDTDFTFGKSCEHCLSLSHLSYCNSSDLFNLFFLHCFHNKEPANLLRIL